ncbi:MULTISPECIES: hypothetical protein [Cyanophyceae]|uniref:Uncharacterized protein n=1 Tax=Leptolyngbya subtilissima DQ-A4 TaxID=2933933 RepID=A0ABV0KCD9_9CYAN|nr:hypothetical protein [Nodosilinea sp. FACHB-141]MBD2111741.1 hypothetical protein [Nodosilinea sp. FACHB-141]
MTDALKNAARAGDPKALEALMNKSFASKGITVRVTNSGSLLRVALRGQTAPDKGVLTMIRQELGSIKPAGFDKVIVTARENGKGDAWSEQWELAGIRPAEPLTASAQPSSSSASKNLVSSERPTPLHQKSWLIIVMLMVFPPGGITLAWISNWPKAIKIGFSIASGFWLLLVVTQQLNEPLQTITQAPATEAAPEASEPKSVSSAQEPTTAQSPDHLQDGKTNGYSAAVAAQSATTSDQWTAVADSWQAAISQLELVPREHTDYAEAQTKIEEYQANKLAALSNKSQAEVAINPELRKSNLTRYREWLHEADPSASIVKSVELNPSDNEILQVTVTIDFLAQNKEVQREAAAGMQAQWARISNPTAPDSAHISLRTPSGKRFGGSHWTAGTRIYIDD